VKVKIGNFPFKSVKKISAILLIAVFLFNLFGYRLLFNYAQQQEDVNFEASLDKKIYDEAELITIKVPLSVPYQNSQQDFERVDGELNINGKIYKYVKRKIVDGELILKCLPDHEKMQLQSAKDDFFKYANDLVQHNDSKKSNNSKAGLFKNLMTEYDNYASEIITHNSDIASLSFHTNYSQHLPLSPHFSPDQPPEIL
jgi:hypothetical protein